MLEKEKAIDAILCATPDHQHAVVCVSAMRLDSELVIPALPGAGR
jgi:predicted dehydrogenase